MWSNRRPCAERRQRLRPSRSHRAEAPRGRKRAGLAAKMAAEIATTAVQRIWLSSQKAGCAHLRTSLVLTADGGLRPPAARGRPRRTCSRNVRQANDWHGHVGGRAISGDLQGQHARSEARSTTTTPDLSATGYVVILSESITMCASSARIVRRASGKNPYMVATRAGGEGKKLVVRRRTSTTSALSGATQNVRSSAVHA